MISAIEPLPENLLRAPLDFLVADHFRQLRVCALLERLVLDPEDPDAAALARTARDYLEQELPQHERDEEDLLLPRLIQRAQADDDIGSMVAILTSEHEDGRDRLPVLLDGLGRLAVGGRVADEAAFLQSLSAFTAMQRRHLRWENEVVLPLARRRLGAADLGEIGHAMALRRGLDYPEPA